MRTRVHVGDRFGSMSKHRRKALTVAAAFLLISSSLASLKPVVASQAGRKGALLDLTASEALDLMESGELTSEAYVTALLRRADQLESLNVFMSGLSWMALRGATKRYRGSAYLWKKCLIVYLHHRCLEGQSARCGLLSFNRSSRGAVLTAPHPIFRW
jgi:hypothetical protein